MNLQDPLFICGVPGSANSTLHSLLTFDTSIVLGLDRYKDYTNAQINSTLLSKDRFFDFETLECDQGRSLPYYKNTALKYFDFAAYIGDQSPNLFLSYDKFKLTFPKSKLVILLRNPMDVCASVIHSTVLTQSLTPNSVTNSATPLSANLVANPIPNAPNSKAIKETITGWNRLLEFVGAKHKDGDVKLVFFEELCSDIKVYLNLYEFLGLQVPKHYEANYTGCIQRCLQLDESSKSLITESLKFEILKTANSFLYQLILQGQHNLNSVQDRTANTLAIPRALKPGIEIRPVYSFAEHASNSAPIIQAPHTDAQPHLNQINTLPQEGEMFSEVNANTNLNSNLIADANTTAASTSNPHLIAPSNPSLFEFHTPTLAMDKNDIQAAQRIFLGQEILTTDEVKTLVGKDGLFVQSYLMKSEYFQSNRYNAALIVSIATELAKKFKGADDQAKQ